MVQRRLRGHRHDAADRRRVTVRGGSEDTSERRVREAERRADVGTSNVASTSSPLPVSARPRPCEVTRRHRRRHSRARQCERVRARSHPRSATGPGGATTFASSSAVRSPSSRCSGSSRRRSQATLSRSYMKRKNQCGAGMAATLHVRLPAGVPDAIRELVVGDNGDERHLLADVRLLAGVTLVVSLRCRSRLVSRTIRQRRRPRRRRRRDGRSSAVGGRRWWLCVGRRAGRRAGRHEAEPPPRAPP